MFGYRTDIHVQHRRQPTAVTIHLAGRLVRGRVTERLANAIIGCLTGFAREFIGKPGIGVAAKARDRSPSATGNSVVIVIETRTNAVS
jgi:hypothetical protein